MDKFVLTLDGSHKASELVGLGKYDYSDELITDERFPIEEHAPTERVIELVKLGRNSTSRKVLAEFKRRGLERPIPEDALYFGIKYPEEYRKQVIVFLHRPVRGLRRLNSVLVLLGFANRGFRYLYLSRFTPGGLYRYERRWHQNHVFAGIRPSKPINDD